ncbi:GNAT family N-acetyltransferase [Colwellia asteriadis]|uniref:tRNA(Met) cytidine acetyltransferase TmcA n=1 Tax=Colwellia asteriadis TaxID=517723 RepID=A0ABP3WKZ0_9GAMM
MLNETFTAWFNALVTDATLKRERRLVVLSGDELWAKSLLDNLPFFQRPLSLQKSCLIYGDSTIFKANVQAKRYQAKLGSESELIIFADSHFTIDALAALSGTLKAGGVLFIITPMLQEQLKLSHFLQRFFSLVNNSHFIISQDDVRFQDILTMPATANDYRKEETQSLNDMSSPYATAEQKLAVIAIKKVLTGHRKRPLVLTADRGRGKSSALAIACAELLLNNNVANNKAQPLSIIISAPSLASVSVFFEQLNKSLPNAKAFKQKIIHEQGSIEFIAIDQLLAKQPTASLVLVDEAAAFPVYLLEQLVRRYHRMVFASTVHGYEGAGRGFTLKFQKILTELCPNWRTLHINEPIRWQQNDPLEQLIFNGCLLNSELPLLDNTKSTILKASLMVERVSVAELLANERLLADAFSILVTAHYQTKPSDLKLLLDNKNVQLQCLFRKGNQEKQLLGVALLIQEGWWDSAEDINAADISAVAASQKRLSNHFIPQSLFVHCGIENAFSYRYLRIMRIAIHPSMQQQGLGSFFIEQINHHASLQSVDFTGASFGSNVELLSYWFKAGFSTARLGFTQDKASGEHSALLLKGISPKAIAQLTALSNSFYRSFDYLLLDEYKGLPTALVAQLLSQQTLAQLAPLEKSDLNNVNAFATGQRVYSSCVFSLYLWFKHELINQRELLTHVANQKMLLVLTSRLIQKHSEADVCLYYDFTGKKMLNNTIKTYVTQLLSATKG